MGIRELMSIKCFAWGLAKMSNTNRKTTTYRCWPYPWAGTPDTGCAENAEGPSCVLFASLLPASPPTIEEEAKLGSCHKEARRSDVRGPCPGLCSQEAGIALSYRSRHHTLTGDWLVEMCPVGE